MRAFSSIAIIIPLIMLIDLLAYRVIISIAGKRSIRFRRITRTLYLAVSLAAVAGLVISYLHYEADPSATDRFRWLMNFNGFFIAQFIPKLVLAVFRMLFDLVRLAKRLATYISGKPVLASRKTRAISRGEFIQRSAVILAAIPLIGIIHGIGWGRFNFTLHRKKVFLPALPEAFEGFRIVQLSDAHLGSFNRQEFRLEDLFQQVNELKPDLILFTGDMVNNFAHEMSGWVPVWKQLSATYGKFSVLGNHDYGGYSEWPTPQARKRNLNDIIRQKREMGFRLLMNEQVGIEKDGSVLYLAGVENWGRPPFPQHGDLSKAMTGIPEGALTILMSHDPDHWDQQVMSKHPQIALTLSGHTHGFQFGIEIGSIRLSPVQLRYKRWAGLYQEGGQYLYVNRGLGYLAFPGRVGIWPEVTLLELTRETSV